ncbi:radical SAM family heme chaperone HemW [bacterium]|nr:radical SAM family heme chaperone HemW [bacterium]
MVKNVYIHIPFCKQKCKYCSFVSFPCIEKKSGYLDALKKEIKSKYKGEKIETLYFGGGTPSLLEIHEVEDLVNIFNREDFYETTFELNPETVDEKYLKSLHKIGINRLSIGCQSFDDEILKNIGRIHNSKQVINVVKLAKSAGFENINLDFIYGLPNQSCESFVNDLKLAAELDIQHISLYGLKIEEGCFFYKNPPKNIADSDLQADMYLDAIKTLFEKNFEHYEISNFSKNGCNSKHNTNYWDNNSYYGFGLAAHGYTDGYRYSNSAVLEDYIQNPCEPFYSHKLTKQEQLEEEIFLGFRKMKGIDLININSKYDIDFEKKYSTILSKYLKSGHILKDGNFYKLSIEGVLVSNIILADFLE